MHPHEREVQIENQGENGKKTGAGREYGHSYERQWLHTSAYTLSAYARGSSCAPRILCQLGGKSVKKSLGKKTGWCPHNGGWDYVGALGIPYSGSASLNRNLGKDKCLPARSCVGYMRRVFTFSYMYSGTDCRERESL